MALSGLIWKLYSPGNDLLTIHQIFSQLVDFYGAIWLGNITRFIFFIFDFYSIFRCFGSVSQHLTSFQAILKISSLSASVTWSYLGHPMACCFRIKRTHLYEKRSWIHNKHVTLFLTCQQAFSFQAHKALFDFGAWIEFIDWIMNRNWTV